MITANSISGGKSSAYISANYPADYNVFCLVRTNDHKLLWQKGKDEKTRQVVSDKLGGIEFIGTLEDDIIIYTILDLEQYLGKEIIWLTGKTFDEIITNDKGKVFLPNATKRFCTTEMKIRPIYDWVCSNDLGVIKTNIGIRADEAHRKDAILNKAKNGVIYFENDKNKPFQMPNFPMIDGCIIKRNVVDFWDNKPVRFAKKNNCVGCVARQPIFLKVMANKYPEKMEWFASKETPKAHWLMKDKETKKYTTYRQIIDTKTTMSMFDEDDFSECDSGYCNL